MRRVALVSLVGLCLSSCGHTIKYTQNFGGDGEVDGPNIEIEVGNKNPNDKDSNEKDRLSDGVVDLNIIDQHGERHHYQLSRDENRYQDQQLAMQYSANQHDSVYGIGIHNGEAFSFSHGEITPDADNLPMSGTVRYQGDAYGSLNKKEIGQYSKGRADISIDFGKGTIRGELYDLDDHGERTTGSGFGSGVQLEGDINDAHFSGSAYNADRDDHASMTGQMAGENGEHLSGSYISDREEGMNGAFGGSR